MPRKLCALDVDYSLWPPVSKNLAAQRNMLSRDAAVGAFDTYNEDAADGVHNDLDELEDNKDVDLHLLVEAGGAEEIAFYDDLGASGTNDDALDDLGVSRTTDGKLGDLDAFNEDVADACLVRSDNTLGVNGLRCDIDATDACWDLDDGFLGDKYDKPHEYSDSASGSYWG